MAGINDLRIRISADGSQAVRGLGQVQTQMGRLRQESVASQRQMAALQGAFVGFASRIAAAFGGISLASSFIEANRAAGLLRASLITITGSMTAANVAWGQLQAFAAQTPFSLDQSTQAFIRLKAIGLDATMESLRSYGNTASAMGKSLIDMIEAVADASTGEFERLKEFGIKASKEGEQVSLTFQGVTTTIANSASEIEKYLRQIGDVQFAGAMARQAETLEGAISNLSDTWSQLMVTLGDAGATEFVIELLRDLTSWLGEVDQYIGSGEMQQDWVDWAIAIDDVGRAIDDLGDSWVGEVLDAILDFAAAAIDAFMELPHSLKIAVIAIIAEADKMRAMVVAALDSLVVQAKILWQNLKASTLEVWYAIEVAIAGVIARLAGDMRDMLSEAAVSLSSMPDLLVPDELIANLQAGAEKWHGYTDAQADAAMGQREMQEETKGQIAVLEAEQAAIESKAKAQVNASNDAFDGMMKDLEAQRQLNLEFNAAVKMQEDLEKGLTKTGETTAGVAQQKAALGKASGAAGKAAKKLSEDQKALNKDLTAALSTVQQLIQRYLPAKAAAMEYAAAMEALALAGKKSGLSQEETGAIIRGLERDMAAAADAARREADGFYAAWADAVDSLDVAFQGLWRNLISGQGDVLGDLKENVLEWIADLSYQLLLSPIVVPIQGALMGMMGGGAAGVTGTATSVLGTASNLGGMSNMFSGLSSAFNVVTNLFSGATFSGISTGFGLAMQNISAAGYFGSIGTNFALAGSSASSGAMGTAIGAVLPYAIPAAIAIAGIGAIVSKWQKDQEPRYGTLAAMTGGSVAGLEDWENGPANYTRGAFGLTLGITDKGSKNMKASELKKTYDALAEVTNTLAEFFGDDLSAFITEELKKLSTFGDGLIHLTENEGDLGAAMAMLVEHIGMAAGKSADDIGIAFGGLVGDLGGTVEEVAEQIQSAMAAAVMAVELSDKRSSRVSQMLGLTGDIGNDVARLKGLIDTFRNASETSGETLGRLVAQLGLLDMASQQTSTSLAGLSTTAMLKLSDDLVAAFGKLEIASQAIAFFNDQFRSNAEKIADVVRQVSKDIKTGLADMIDELSSSLGKSDLAVLRDQLTGPLLENREGFIALIDSLDLTTEAGRKLYAELLKLAPQFDVLYDGVEAFTDWLMGVNSVERATRELERVFGELGIAMPSTREALEELYRSGMLSAEQMAILAAYLKELGVVFGNLGEEVDKTTQKVVDYTDLYIRLAEAQGNSKLALQLRRQQELNNATDEYSRALLRLIYAAEDAARAAEEAEAARREAWEESERQRRAAYDAEVEAIRAWNSAAQAAADEANQAAREALQAMQQAAEDAYRVASSIASAWIEAISSLGLVTEATALQRRLETAAMDSSLRAAYSQVWAIQDQAAIAGGRADLATQALGLLGRDADALAAQRRLTLAGTDPALRAMQEWVFTLEDAQRAAQEAATGIESLISNLEQVSDAIGATIDQIEDLMMSPLALQAQRRAEAQSQLTLLLAAAKAGTMPTSGALEKPLATLSNDPAALFGNRVDYLRDLGRTRGQLVELQAIVDAQIPIEQQHLEALKNLPVALFPNFESIVSAIGQTSGDTAALLSQATAAIDAAIAAAAARDEAMRQTIREITPAVREIPPYVEDVYDEIVIQTGQIDAMRAQMISDSNILFAKMDTDSNQMVTKTEFLAQLSGKATDVKLQALWDGLDVNHDDLLSATELIPLQVATKLSGYFNTLDQNTDSLLTFAELQYGLAGIATDYQIRQLISAVDANGDGMISQQESSFFKLDSIDYQLKYQDQNLKKLHSIELHTKDMRDYERDSLLNLRAISQYFTGTGYAIGGISAGPSSGYPVTLHGREAIIPLGDGNSVTAYLKEPTSPPPNYIAREADDTQALREALAELHKEIAALRQDGQVIGANTIGELKEHNRRERRRDVNGTLVEVMS